MANENKGQSADPAEAAAPKPPKGTTAVPKTPEKGETVLIVTAYGDRVPAKVTGANGDRIDVELTYRDALVTLTGVQFDPEGNRPDSWTRG